MSSHTSPSSPASGPADAASLYAAWRGESSSGGDKDLDALCARHPEHSDAFRELHARYDYVDQLLGSSLLGDIDLGFDDAGSPDAFEQVLERLNSRRPNESRYEERREIGRGGMGSILELYDVDLRRPLAKKVVRPDAHLGDMRGDDSRLIGRFLEEAQITAQLAHPGVVPVHELGIDEQGRVFFTMDLVRGRTLQDVFELARRDEEGWNLTRAVTVLERVCETLAYAHSRGVIHRDLKPGNVMVGEFGEVYVMDWGLARLLDRDDHPGDGSNAEAPRPVSTDRNDASSRDTFVALKTVPGTAAGTPGFMAPEQARGELDRLDARTDVFALGALLYSLLTGARPYESKVEGDRMLAMFEAMRAGAYRPIAEVAPGAPPELVSIAERAMAAEPDDRYPSGVALAADLRAWLEGRVVSAHERGTWAELRKWIARNRGLSASLAVVFLAVSGGATGMAVFERNGRLGIEHQRAVADISAAPTQFDGLVVQAESLWPALPSVVPALEHWLKEKAAFDDKRGLLEEGLAAMNGDLSAFRPDEFAPILGDRLGRVHASTAELDELESSVRARLDLARNVRELTIDGDAARRAWSAAIESVRESDHYGGLELTPQLGLLPLRVDPNSGLWEFWHVLSGDRPGPDDETGAWRIDDETGVVLVLIPAASTDVGSPDVGEEHPLYDWVADEYDRSTSDPLQHAVVLDAFFLSKYELTQGQWMRSMRANPSQVRSEADAHPVDTVSWDTATTALARLDLELPTEAQWEVAARGGAETCFYTGQAPQSLSGHANLKPDFDLDGWADEDEQGAVIRRFGREWYQRHEPVGSALPNPFGLHDVHGNVWEWCRDVYARSAAPREGDGLRTPPNENTPKRVMRGGGYDTDWANARLTMRFVWERQNGEPDSGVRPARSVRRSSD